MSMNRLLKHLRYCFDYILHFMPNNKNQVMFISFDGQYNCNPKYISEKLHEISPNTKILWVISEKCHQQDRLPTYIKTVKFGTFKAEFAKNRSKVLIDNGVGWHIMRTNQPLLRKYIKRKDQLNLSTHHGTILKKGGADYSDGIAFDENACVTTSDILIAGSYYNANRLRQCYFSDLPIIMTGMPRNDLLLDDNIDITELRKKIGLPVEDKLLLYAPSYRKNIVDAGIEQLRMMRIPDLLTALSRKFGGKWKIVFRAHNLVVQELNKNNLLSEDILDGNQFDDMAEYMKACDILMTDFSGCLFDNAITSKPCFFFAHDIDHYINSERGTYFGLDKLPYPVARSFDELLRNIQEYDAEIVARKRDILNSIMESVEDGHASELITDLILKYMNGKYSKENILKNATVFKRYKGELQ